ncbi:hypothetical protein IF2G_10097 [Cordyceps javanica]|nr:hypothetical protein IF2G_10097 [Cordyceps javanica]
MHPCIPHAPVDLCDAAMRQHRGMALGEGGRSQLKPGVSVVPCAGHPGQVPGLVLRKSTYSKVHGYLQGGPVPLLPSCREVS